MYYIRLGMGERWRWLAALFAFCTILASFGMGNLVQINTIAQAMVHALPSWDSWHVSLITGAAAAAVAALVLLGGVKRLGSLMERLVPLLAGIYILGGLGVIFTHWQSLGYVLADIVRGAFCPQAVLGGGAGIGIRQAVRWGVSRGVFSNEAGLGSAPMAHAAEARPEDQGLMGIFEVFLDTIVLCTLTALTILVSGVDIPYGNPAGAELVVGALSTVFGGFAPGLTAVILSLLALATILSWSLYGSTCARYLWGEWGSVAYQIVYVLAILVGAVMDLSAVWTLADCLNGLMMAPNLIAVLALSVKLTGGEKALKVRHFGTIRIPADKKPVPSARQDRFS